MRMKPFGYHGAAILLTIASKAAGYVLGENLVLRDETNTTIPAPVVASVSQYWEGNDGPWSSFAIQVGKTAQNVRVFPSTASTSTLVVINVGCPEDAPSNCKDARGGLFNKNNSLTWVPNSIFDVGIEENLGFNVFGDFGFDTVTLGWQGSGGPTVEHSIVAGLGDTTMTWLGVLGLNPRPTNFSTFVNNPQVSLVQSLKNQEAIPSVSWAYTAGAQYRLDKIYGSLIFGGYDTSRFTPSTLTFPFYEDISRNLVVGVQKISSSGTSLLETGVFAFIDSTLPYFYLPTSACSAFETAFGLTWNSTSELYLVNSTQHASLLKQNANITFTLGTTTSGGETVDIVLPYAAFDLNISWPHVEETTRYFPLKRATNDTQYTLGRAFLQEAYLIADYERFNFSVHPCKWEPNAKSSIVAIRSVNDTTENPSNTTTPTGNKGGSHSSSLGGGTIAGIVIGAITGAAILGAGWYLMRRRGLCGCGEPSELDATETEREQNRPAVPLDIIRAQKAGDEQELDSSGIHELPSHHKFGVLEAPGGDETFPKPSELDEQRARQGRFSEVFEMDSGPIVRIEPPTAIETEAPDLPTPGQLEAVERAQERRVGHDDQDEER
ncbi:acid protease [Mytilinidion resinicola]|uniref:Acid protease n=1 Tax=Mytilinidion resinicola TaxID=574789 RepID=A0A6A6YCM8_9PEZI|nr:acid protease [Mytilinidion resinicola]KAF2806460.1 acid protease [Mytilinidion resinicola]